MEAAHEKSGREQPETLGAKCLLERIPRRLRAGHAWRNRAGTTILAQSERQNDHQCGKRGEHEHRHVPVVEAVLENRGDRHDRECPNEPPAVATPSATDRCAGGVCRAIAPKIGPKPAAAKPTPESTLPRVSITPSLASAIISMPAT